MVKIARIRHFLPGHDINKHTCIYNMIQNAYTNTYYAYMDKKTTHHNITLQLYLLTALGVFLDGQSQTVH